MNDSTYNLWKPDKRAAVRLLAIGCSQQYTADHVGAGLRTVQNWCAEDEFDRIRTELRELAWSRVEPGIMANVELALEVQAQMFRGDIKPDDKRYASAERLIYRILDRLLYVEPLPTGHTTVSSPSLALQINSPTAP